MRPLDRVAQPQQSVQAGEIEFPGRPRRLGFLVFEINSRARRDATFHHPLWERPRLGEPAG